MSVQINVAANQAALISSIQAGVQAYNQRFANNNQINLNINARAFSQPLGRITGDVKDFEAALAASNARVIAFGASTAVLGGVIRSFKELASVTIDVEKNLADINRVFGLSTSQLQKFSTELFNVSKQTASTFDNASKAALEFSRQGLKAEETLQRTKDALTLTRLAGIGTANAVDALTSTVNGFAATGVTTSQILNKLIAVEQDFAVGAGDLAEALSRTGQAAQEAGVSLDQLNALVTSAQQSTARGGAVIGNALKTIFTRLQRTETLDQLEAFNIAVRDVQGNILPAVTILQNFAGAYKNLADAQRAQLSEQVAGVYQVNILKAIVNDLNQSQGVYAGALQRGAMATNEAEIATAKLNKTLDALLSQTATSAQQLANNIGKVTFEPLARYGTEQLKSLVESMNEILEGEGIGSTFANGLLKGIRNILAGPGAIAAFFTLFKLIQNSFSFLTQALPQIAGITTETQNRKNIEQSILQIMQQQGPISQALAGTMGNQAAQAQLLLQLARQQTAEYQQQSALAKQLAAQLAGQGVKVAGARGLQVTRAGGYIPASTKIAEVVGAKAGGYSPGRVVPSPVGGVMNTAEDVKYIPGFAQPFINPPANSKAGRAHRQNAINRTGVDPYMNDGFIPNFAYKNFRFKNNELNLNRQSIKDFSDPSYFEKRNLADGGLNKNGKPNDIYDTVSGVVQRIPFVKKKQFNLQAEKYFSAYLKDEPLPFVVKESYDRAFNKIKNAGFYGKVGSSASDIKTVKNQMLDKFNAKNKGDFYNFRGSLYESYVAKKAGSQYKLAESEYSRSDVVPIDPEIAGLFTGIEAKSGSTGGNWKILQKAIETAIKQKQTSFNEDKLQDIPIGKYALYQTYNDGFIPNFSPLIDDNARNKHDFPGGVPILPIPDKALQNIVDRQKKRQMTYLDFDRTLVRTMGDIAYSRVSPDQKKGVLQKMFLNKEARLNDIKSSKLTQFGELLRKKIQEGVINPSLLGLLTASDETPGMPEYISSIWGIPKRNQVYSAKPGTKEARLAILGVSASGFIPNFAPPTSAMRIPWFKKFANPAYDNIQPTLGISKASDVDTLNQINFRSSAKGADKVGDPNIFGPLYENFVTKALQLVNQSNIFGEIIEGKILQPTVDPKQVAIDRVLKTSTGYKGLEIKGHKKGNLKGGSTAKHLSNKLERLAKTNPEEAAKMEELIMIFNETGHENQLPSEFGKNFIQLAGTSYSQMLKNSPTLVKELSNETNMLLERYVKDPNFLRMNAAGGFIPNFAEFIKTEIDKILKPISKSKTIQSKQLFGKTLDDDAIKYLNITTLDRLNKFLYADGYLDVALGFPFGDRAYEKYLFTKNKGFIPNFSELMKGYAFNDGRIYNDVYHSDAWDSIEGPRTGAIKYANYNGKLVYQAKNISEKLKQAFISRGIPKSEFSPVEDVDAALRSGNTKEIQDKLRSGNTKEIQDKSSQLGAVQLSEGIKAIYENGRYTTFIKDNKSLRILGGITPDELKMFGGVDRFLAYRERVHGVQKWQSFANGFIPNFADLDADLDTDARRMLINSGTIPFVVDLERRRIAESSAADDMFHSQIVNKKFIDPKTEKPIYPKLYKDDIHSAFWKDTFVRGFVDSSTAKVHFDLTTPQKEDKNFMQKYSVLLEQVRNKYAKKFEEAINKAKQTPPINPKNPPPSQKLRNQLGPYPVNHFNNGFIPNFNFIKGRNSFQKNWLIETAKKRNLNLNDPNVFHQLATEFAKTYPNDQGMFGLSKGFIPNFAYKQSVMSLEESMSGNKAIFDTKPFPHIRNSSQPTFSSAIADHGGLDNALSDSMRGQKAAGLMSEGFIPNFVKYGPSYSYMPSGVPSGSSNYYPSGNPNKSQAVSPTYQAPAAATNATFQQNDIDKALQDFINSVQAADQKLGIFESTFGGRTKIIDSELIKLKNTLSKGGVSGSKLNEALDNASTKINSEQTKLGKALEKSSTTLAIAGPLIAGQLEQLFFANKKRTELSETERAVQSGLSTGLTSISTGASIGAAFGPLGAGIGAATGALVGLTSALSATKLSAEELADLNQEQAQKAQANISAASSYIEAQKSLTQMIASGASSSDIENASKKLAVNFKEIEDVKLQEIFNSTGGDVKKMTEELQKYSNEISRRSAFQKGIIEKSDVKTTVQALSIGIPKQNKKDVIEGFRKAASFSQSEMQYEQAIKQAEYGSNRKNNEGKTYKQVIDEAEKFRKENIASSLENFIPRLLDIGGITKDDPQYKSEFDNALKKFKSLPPEKLKEIADNLEKADLVSGVSQSINRLNNVATKSFNQIFLEIEQRIAKTAFDISLNFERDSGQRRIQSAILDFSINFQDSINSFLSNNLPDARKFDFTAATAGQKAQLQLQKSQQDYDKAIAEQANERSMFLNKSTKDLTETFKSSFLPSQASAQFFEQNVLSQLESGTFSGDAKSLAKQMQTKAFTEAQAPVKAAGFNLNDINNVDTVLKQITDKMEAVSTSAGATSDEYIKLESALRAIQELQKQTALYTNDNDVKKLQNAIDSYTNEKALFDLKQANAKKELEINKQLNEARIAIEKDIAVEKARVDKENLMRMEKMKDLSANIGNASEISKARSTAAVNAMQRRLEDQRETFGMSRTQISERKFGIQADILKEQRAAEDAAISAEIQQRILEMAAEQENTAATLKLNDTIMTLIETQLRGALGGEENIKDIQAMVYEMGESAQSDVDLKYGKAAYSQYQALQRIQESRVASAASNTDYNTSTFESNIQSKGFNEKMTQAEQLTFLEQEETAARKAGNVVLAGTIKRYQEQITTKKDALQITRDDIDAQVRLNVEVERVNNTFAGRFKKGWGNLKSEGNDLILNLGENLPRMFGDGLVDGIKAAIRESDNLGDALMGIASKFLDEVSTIMMRAGIYQILGSFGFGGGGGAFSFGQKQKGGLIRAQSGMYISGTGSGDKYPALLENGEYVLNRRAVMAMGGPSALDTLNFSMAPRFASGGSFKSELSDIKSMEEGMTTFGLENSSYYRELRDEESRRAEEARQRKRQKQAERAQLIGSIVASVATAAIGAGLQNISSNAQAKAAEQMVTSGAGAAASAGLSKYGDTPQLYAETGLTKTQVQSYKKAVSSGYLNPSGTYTLKTPRSGIKSVLPPSTKGRQTGGLIGSRLSDTIPGYMEGGLYNSPIIKRYGTGMQAGGMSSIANNSNVVNNSNASNSFNFNTTVNRDGAIQMGANSTSYKQQDVELSENLNNRIYGAVLEVIRDQQRFGGSLAGTRKA